MIKKKINENWIAFINRKDEQRVIWGVIKSKTVDSYIVDVMQYEDSCDDVIDVGQYGEGVVWETELKVEEWIVVARRMDN